MSLSELISLTRNNVGVYSQARKLLFVRSCENVGLLSGSLNGWLDTRLSDYGKKQARHLSVEYFVHLRPKIDYSRVFTSDLMRCKETADICLGYDQSIKHEVKSDLREINFGKQEGFFYDGISKEEKTLLNDPKRQFPNGEAWLDLKFRSLRFLQSLTEEGDHQLSSNLSLVFTHGGIINSLLSSSGTKKQLPPGSLVLMTLNDNKHSKEDKDLLDNYNKNRLTKEIEDDFFNNYNPSLNTAIAKHIQNVDLICKVPDLTDNIY